MIIGLVGLKNSGKDTVGAYLIKQYGFERRAFADKLKESTAALLDIPVNILESMKNDPTIQVIIGRMQDTDDETAYAMYRQAIRSFWQRYGKEAHRDVFGQDFWVDQLLPVGGFYAGRAIVITDVRYRNEYDRVKTLGGYIALVDRPGLDEKDPHSSEDLSWLDQKGVYHLLNNSTVEDLYRRVDEMLGELPDDSV